MRFRLSVCGQNKGVYNMAGVLRFYCVCLQCVMADMLKQRICVLRRRTKPQAEHKRFSFSLYVIRLSIRLFKRTLSS